MTFALLSRLRTVRPAASFIARLTATATFAYLLALVIPVGTNRPVLAPLTALLVLQDQLADLLRPRIGDGGEPSEWPLRGELLTHVDRLRTGPGAEAVDAVARMQRSARHPRRPRPRAEAPSGDRAARLRPPGQLRPRSSRARNSAHRAR
jgi:hypothetical protein